MTSICTESKDLFLASSLIVALAVSHSEQFARVNNVTRAECCHRLYDGLMAGNVMCQDDACGNATQEVLAKCTDLANG